MTDQEIEQLVLDIVQASARKVALIIVKVTNASGIREDEEEKFHLRVEVAIQRLVARQILGAAGNISNWRHSEVWRIT
jgi:hypothetical protein